MILKQHISCSNLAKLLDVTPKTIRNWATAPDKPLPGKRIKGVWLFDCEKVLNWLRTYEEGIDLEKITDDLINNLKEYDHEDRNA